MKCIKNIALCIGLSFVICQPALQAQRYALSAESAKHVALMASIGALVTGGVTYFLLSLDDDQAHASFKTKSVAVIAALGAAITGAYSYYNTPEKILEWLEETLSVLEHNELMEKIATSQGLSQLQIIELMRDAHWNERYPSVSSVSGLNWLYHSLGNLKNSLIDVKNSCIAPVCHKARQHILSLTQIQRSIKQAIVAIKNNSLYLQELSAQENAAHLCQVAQAQQELARAQQKIAQAAWIQATKPHSQSKVVIVNK